MSLIRSRLEGARRTLRDDATFRAVLKHTGWLTGSSGALLVLTAVQGILTGRMLGVVQWGVLGVASSFCGMTGRLLSFRMNEFVVKWVTHFRADSSARAGTAFKLALAGDVTSALVAFLIVELLAGWGASTFAKNADFVWVFRLLALTVALQSGRESWIGMLHVNRDFRTQSLVQTACQTVGICAIGIVYAMDGGLRSVVIVLIATEALVAVSMWKVGLRAARSVLSEGWMLRRMARLDGLGREMGRFAVLGNLSGTLNSVMNEGDLLLLGYLRSPVEVAYYKLAKSISMLASLPMMPLVQASYPEFSTAVAARAWTQFRALMRRGSQVAALWLVPTSIGLAVAAPFVISALYGPSFVPAAAALNILLLGVLVDGVLYWTRVTLLSMGEPGYPTAVYLWTTLAKYALAFMLVPGGGYLALAGVSAMAVVGMNGLTARRALARLRLRESMADA